MAKAKPFYECQACGLVTPKWMGKCTNCGAWDSFVELKGDVKKAASASKTVGAQAAVGAIQITEIREENVTRFPSGEPELDTVLGGGIVPGSLTLVGGSPGVGKSTLLLKVGGNLAAAGKKVLYVSGEESAGQIKLRANRIGANKENLYLLSAINMEAIVEELDAKKYDLAIIDSIQTIYSENNASAPGSVTQVREITFELMRYAKAKDVAMFIIGHITKEGSIAGPRVLEHMVDTVLYFEGDASRELRILRGFKNRFGSTSELGIFEMAKEGLVSAGNVADKFFTHGEPRAGSAVTVILEGTRPLLIEVQALVAETGFPSPKRSATGYESNRLTMLLALLEKKLELPFNQYDVFINIAGGIKITEPAADLAVVAAILSSFKERPIAKSTVFLGEVALIGDIREVYNLDQRLREAKSQGFVKAVLPKLPMEEVAGVKCYAVGEVAKLLDWM